MLPRRSPDAALAASRGHKPRPTPAPPRPAREGQSVGSRSSRTQRPRPATSASKRAAPVSTVLNVAHFALAAFRLELADSCPSSRQTLRWFPDIRPGRRRNVPSLVSCNPQRTRRMVMARSKHRHEKAHKPTWNAGSIVRAERALKAINCGHSQPVDLRCGKG